jgi:uncharacterized glyoxalase superfamily protein PhnB
VTASLEITLDSTDSAGTAAFWSEALRYERLYERGSYIVLAPSSGDARPRLVIQQVDRVTREKTPVHLDVRVDDPDAEVERLTALGATVEWVVDETDLGLSRWTTMSDPHGILFCVAPARG